MSLELELFLLDVYLEQHFRVKFFLNPKADMLKVPGSEAGES